MSLLDSPANPTEISTSELEVSLLEGGVAVVRLNRPQATNALNLSLQAALSRAFLALGADANVRCIVLTGGDKVFAAGGDIKSLDSCGPIEILERHTERVWAPIEKCPKPIIAAVCGYAFGGGSELAMHCDIIIAGKSASFAQPEIRIGIMPGIGGTQRLVRAVGKFQAMRILLTGKPISAAEAYSMGLVSLVCEDDLVQAEALKMASLIAAMPPLAVEQIKEVVIAGMDASLDTALMLERKANQILFATQDQKEGMSAFIEKRKPVFEGR
ncbi:Enoyl-CoA hydratase-isomerase [Comamonas aquatilis]|uniref:enoyl-CoA hydratase n=1 Tax=Comamonas aquatilis TaxID=1778406 RepID=UPI0039EFF1BD